MSKSGSSGRTRINIQTYFQQHAGRRMTPKTVESSRNQINRAQIERISTTSVMYISSQNDKRNLIRRRLPWTSESDTGQENWTPWQGQSKCRQDSLPSPACCLQKQGPLS